MGVTTSADEAIDRAIESIRAAESNIESALESLKVATHPDTWGSGDYNTKYKEKLKQARIVLLELQISLLNITL